MKSCFETKFLKNRKIQWAPAEVFLTNFYQISLSPNHCSFNLMAIHMVCEKMQHLKLYDNSIFFFSTFRWKDDWDFISTCSRTEMIYRKMSLLLTAGLYCTIWEKIYRRMQYLWNVKIYRPASVTGIHLNWFMYKSILF